MMQLSDIFLRMGPEQFEQLLRSISLGRLKTFQMFEPFKTRLHLHKLNTEALRKCAPRQFARLQEEGNADLATDLSQAILISHMDMIKAVLDELGVPHEDGFFAKDTDVSTYLKDGWQKTAWDKFHDKYPPAGLLFYINHLAWEVTKAEDSAVAIFAAAIFGDATEIEMLLAGNRSLVNAVSPDGWLPLHLAAHFGHADAVRALLNKGAKANAPSTNAMRNTALHAAAAGRSATVAKLLLDAGADVNARQAGGWTPLHSAAQNGDIEFARVLTEAGADVSVRADNQQRPLDLALTKGQQAMVDFLEAQGASL